jgi:ADP-ribose pyrophosphatase YjhB (NUDIX family)
MSDPQHIVAVAGAFFNEAGQVLLVRTEQRGWECPGGQVEEGEDLIAALVREVQEETGCVVEVERLVGVYTNPVLPSKVMFMFVGKYVGGVLGQSDEQEAGWYTFVDNELKKLGGFVENRITYLLPGCDRDGALYLQQGAEDREFAVETGVVSPRPYRRGG